jgi:hypothetical protein
MYLYFDYKGTLLETVNDQALRQYNKGVNTVNIYIESEPDSATGIVPDDGKIPSYITGIQYWFQLANGDKLNNLVYEASNKIKKTIPFDRNRDLRHFKYGKSYEFFSFQVPSGEYKKDQNDNVIDFVCEGDVFKSSGLVLMTVQALTMRTNDDGTEKRGTLSLERVAFTVEDAVVLPDDIVSSSEFNWLLQQYAFGDYLRAQLVYMKVDKITSSHAFTIDGDKYSIDLDTSLFNRQPPKIGDAFLYVYENGADKGGNITMAIVENVTGDVTKCSFSITDTISIKDVGKTPNITATATVSSTVGTPSVSVTKTGTNENPNLAFDFKNLKGETGATPQLSAYATADQTQGVPDVEVSVLGTELNPYFRFDFKHLVGPTGLSGANGKDALFADKADFVDSAPPTTSTVYTFKLSHFNRTPIEGEQVWQFVSTPGAVTRSLYACYCSVQSVTSTDATLRVMMFYPLKGETGTQGQKGETIQSIETGDYTQDDTYTQTPVTVTTTDNNQTTFSVRAKNGKDGGQGPVGLAGKDALVCTKMVRVLYDTNVSNQSIDIASTWFNREPVIGETCVVYSKENNYAIYQVKKKRTYYDNSVYYVCDPVSDILYTKGATGERGNDGVGISSASVKSTSETEEYTSTTVSIAKTDGTSSDIVVKAKNGINPNTVSFIGTVTVDMWQDSTTYSTYGYKYSALMPFTGGAYATDTYVPDVVPSVVSDITSGNFAPFANSLSTGVQIYAKTKPTATTNFNVSLSHVQ